MNRQTFNSFQGQAAVHRVMSELFMRQINCYTPSVDTGTDLITESGCRVQVKSTLRASRHWRFPEGTFAFALSNALCIKKGYATPRAARKFSSHCDIIVLWAIEANRFWIVPAHILDGRHSIHLSTRHQWKEGDIKEMQAMRDQGLSYREIGEKLGMNGHTVIRRINGKFSEPKRNYASFRVKEHENRWDLIESFGGITAAKLEEMYNSVGKDEPNLLLTTPEHAAKLREMYPENKEQSGG